MKKLLGEDPILILNFITKYFQEAYVLGMSEAQAYISLPYFLSGFAEYKFNSVRETTRALEGGVSC